MVAVKLEVDCSKRVDGIGVEPEPDWSFDALISELNALETKLTTSFTDPSSFDKTISRGKNEKIERAKPFILRADEYEIEDTESEDDDDDDKEEENEKGLVVGKRFVCDELYLSDSDNSDVVSAFEVQPYLMEEVGEVEGALFELTHDHQLRVKDEIRNKISALETTLVNESQNSASALHQVGKYKESRQELDKKFDTQYRRRIAEALDNHLTAVQQDRELRSQIEERKLRSDAAYEEAKRKIALQEEKQQQEKAKAEAEVPYLYHFSLLCYLARCYTYMIKDVPPIVGPAIWTYKRRKRGEGTKDRMGKELVEKSALEGSYRTAMWHLEFGGKDAGIMRVDMNNMGDGTEITGEGSGLA